MTRLVEAPQADALTLEQMGVKTRTFGSSERGTGHITNDDAYYINQDGTVGVVADGVSIQGTAGRLGRRGADLACYWFAHWLENQKYISDGIATQEAERRMNAVVREVNKQIVADRTAGSTTIAGYVRYRDARGRDMVTVGSAGDSRVYMKTGGRLLLLTPVDADKELDSNGNPTHTLRNCLGALASDGRAWGVAPRVASYEVPPDAQFLVVTDGVDEGTTLQQKNAAMATANPAAALVANARTGDDRTAIATKNETEAPLGAASGVLKALDTWTAAVPAPIRAIVAGSFGISVAALLTGGDASSALSAAALMTFTEELVVWLRKSDRQKEGK